MDLAPSPRRFTVRAILMTPVIVLAFLAGIIFASGIIVTRFIKYISPRVLHRIQLANRTVLRPFIHRRILGETPPTTIATYDLLSLIVPHLSRRELLSCCQASRLFFEVAGKQLCSTPEGVVAGYEVYYTRETCESGDTEERREAVSSGDEQEIGTKRAGFVERATASFFGELDRPCQIDAPKNSSTGAHFHPEPDSAQPTQRPTYINYPLVRPSKTKLQLLQYIRHLTYIPSHIPYAFDEINSTELFPSLHTLTIQPNAANYEAKWKGPFLSNLTPKHIRITRIPFLGVGCVHCVDHCLRSLDLSSRDKVEKVTLHIMDPHLEGNYGSVLRVEWPTSVDRIDLVFHTPDQLGSTAQLHPEDKITCTFIQDRHPLVCGPFRAIARSVVQLLSSAEKTGATIRIIGLGHAEGSWGLTPRGKEKERNFRAAMKEEYVRSLLRAGMRADEVKERAEGLSYESLRRYREENGYLPL